MKVMLITMMVAFGPVLMLMPGLPNTAYCSPLSGGDGDHMHLQAPSLSSPSLSVESQGIPHNTHVNTVPGTPQPKASGVAPSWIDRCPKYYPGLDDLLSDLGDLLAEGLVHIDGYVLPQWCQVFQGPTKNAAQICFCENLRDQFGYSLEVGRELLAACQKKPTKLFCRGQF